VAESSGSFNVGIGDVTSSIREAMASGSGKPLKALAQEPWTMHPDNEDALNINN
jgi:hypothetical protein